ncbi:hypothetical protein SD70_08480 [Gordoniibacillus kamchatkensis]|uniref:GGDEF domain-containing protein n=1 Tax=Gordoniibacillus kamchatkensis TaxID=1590651 RepID=A0ABR5AK24_9BACL|nr:hypothetical protein [Paenibacillus sp. VKM B-2647]KIL41272.1 hypothetical protein SD70_08480 [Paenibacillus sp. VKM B-2647]
MNKTNLSFIFALFLSALFLAVCCFTKAELMFMACSMLAVGFINILFRPMIGFAALIAYVLGLGFYNIAANWGAAVTLLTQKDKLIAQAVYSLAAIAVWLLIYRIKLAQQSIRALEQEAETLRKLEPATGVLTFAEFMERAKLLYVGMRRRKESGFYVVCELLANDGEKPYQQRVIYEKMMSGLLASTRHNYDLVGNYGACRAIVFLSNIDRRGVDLVLGRFERKAAGDSSLSRNLFRIAVHDLASTEWEQFEQAVVPLRGGKAS